MNDRPLLAVESLTKRFGGLVAVDGLSFTLKPGEIPSNNFYCSITFRFKFNDFGFTFLYDYYSVG